MASACSRSSSLTISRQSQTLDREVTDVNFYQLASKPLDAVLPRLLEKAVAAGFRTVIRATDPALLARLDGALWTYDAASFLPHAVDGPFAAEQPVLLTTDAGGRQRCRPDRGRRWGAAGRPKPL